STDPVARQAGAEGTPAWMLGLVVLLAGSGGATGAIRLLMDRLMTGGLIPTGDLEGAAEQVALTGSATIPHLDLTDEIGDAARALREWQAASWEREVLLERNPVGLGILDTEGRVRRSNAAFRALFGRTDGAFVDGLLPGGRPATATTGARWRRAAWT